MCLIECLLLGGMSLRWSLKLFMLMRTQILSNTSVKEEVAVVGDWVSCTGGAVEGSKKAGVCAYKSVHFPRA